MHSRTILTLALVVFAGTFGHAQDFSVVNQAKAAYVSPGLDTQGFATNDRRVWRDRGQETMVSARSKGDAVGVMENFSHSMSHFSQPNDGDATIRSSSVVVADYNFTFPPPTMFAETNFSLRQALVVEINTDPGLMFNMKLAIPMHGILAGMGSNLGTGVASAGMKVTMKSATRSLIDEYEAGIEVTYTDKDVFTVNASSNWASDYSNKSVTMPTEDGRVHQGVELTSYDLINLGPVRSGDVTAFFLEYDMWTKALSNSTAQCSALSDFSGTGGFKFLAYDQNGNPFHDFKVTAVPEPASLVAIGIGCLALRRRARALPA